MFTGSSLKLNCPNASCYARQHAGIWICSRSDGGKVATAGSLLGEGPCGRGW
jgi:hypothetical protein